MDNMEIDFISFFKYAMKYKIIMIVVSVVLAAATTVGVYFLQENSKDSRIEKLNEEIEAYEENYDKYLIKVSSLEEQLEILNAGLAEQSVYLKDSLYMSINGWGTPCYTKEIILSSKIEIEGKQHIDREKLFSLIQEELTDNLKGIGTIVDCSDEYTIEMFDIKYDSATNLITIRVLYPNMDKANDIANFVVKKFKLIKEKYDYFNDYEIQTTDTMLNKVSEDSISFAQNEKIKIYKDQYSAITDRKNELNKLKEPNPPKMESISRKNEAKNAILAGVGVFLIVWIIYLVLRYLHMSSKGVLVTAGDCCKASMLYALADFTKADKEYAYERLQAFIPLVAKESKKIMFLGKVDDTMLQELVSTTKKSMKDYSIKGGVDIEKNSAVLKDTIDSDVVVLVIQREYTLFRDIKRQQKILEDLGKKVIGCVVC